MFNRLPLAFLYKQPLRAVGLSHNLAIIKDYLSDRTDDTNSLCLTSTSNNIPDDNNSSNLIDNCSTITVIIRSVVCLSSFDLDLAQAIEPEIVQKLQQGVNTSIQQHDSFFRQFSNKHQELLQQYYDANQLLVNCLNSACEVSDEVREEIEETLLLPIVEIEKRQQQM